MPELELRDWLPQEPNQGPPLPEFLNIYWPWYKLPPPEEVIGFDLTKPSVTPAEIAPDTLIAITCPVTSACAKEQTVTAKVIIYEGSILPGHGTKIKEYTSPAFTISPGQTYNVAITHSAVAGTIDRRDIEVEIYIAGKLVKESEWDDVYYVTAPPAVPEFITFSVEVYNIPSYAAGSYQWYIDYGGEKHGMVDPQAGIWTPITDPIVVADVKPSGALRATLHAGPYQSWYFTASRTFKDSEAYRFNLSAGFIEGPGIALTNLIVEPAIVTVGESVTISVDAVNSEDTEQQYEVTFTIGSTVEKKAVSLGPKETKEVSLEVTPKQEGSFSVKVDGLYGTFTALAPPEPPPPGGVWTWRNTTFQLENGGATFSGEIYVPEIKGEYKTEAGYELYGLDLILDVTGYVIDTWVGPDGRSYAVYEYFIEGKWTTTSCYDYYFPGRKGVLKEEYDKYCTDIPRRLKLIPGKAYTTWPSKAAFHGPCAAGWFEVSASGRIGYPPYGPHTIKIYSEVSLWRWVAVPHGVSLKKVSSLGKKLAHPFPIYRAGSIPAGG